MPSVILYVMDTPRNENVASFMSNMLYACKVAMSYQLPFIAVFNKVWAELLIFTSNGLINFNKSVLFLDRHFAFKEDHRMDEKF